MKTIAICNHKGGVGKTTTAINIAAGLAAERKRVLLIDLDAQANLTDCLRITNTDFNIYDILRGNTEPIPITITPHIDAIPAVLDLATAEVELNAKIGREYLLKRAVERVAQDYDCILLDCPPSLGLLTMNAFTAADAVVIPIQAEYFALKGIAKLAEVIDNVKQYVNPALHIGGIILTQYNSRTILHKQMREAIEARYGDVVFSTPVRNSITIAEAQAKQMDVFTYAPDSGGAEDYNAITQEFIRKFCL